MSFAIALTDEQWELVADLYRPRVSGATFTRGDQPAKLPRANWFLADRQIARQFDQWQRDGWFLTRATSSPESSTGTAAYAGRRSGHLIVSKRRGGQHMVQEA